MKVAQYVGVFFILSGGCTIYAGLFSMATSVGLGYGVEEISRRIGNNYIAVGFVELLIGVVALGMGVSSTGQTTDMYGKEAEVVVPQATGAIDYYRNSLLDAYRRKYPNNPDGLLEWHIYKATQEGRTREQAEEELAKQLGIPLTEQPAKPATEPAMEATTRTPLEDPILILKIRLAKGEISKQQYEELLEAIRSQEASSSRSS